ncbi:hypothetical protein G6F22_014354 [Rhizopus arrhizus]|nr:hypothetical protein G6F22_014354 [Rhizopus arrhizus]
MSQVLFPQDNPTVSLLAALGALAVGFIIRPLGAVMFGYLGDKWGRKYTFLITVVMMGGATVLIGCLPTYESAGHLSWILLLTLRVVQGLAVGGEYGGAVIYVAEHCEPRRRGLLTGWIQITSSAGLILSPAEGSDTAQLRQALGANANVLLFNRELEGADWDFLTLDNQHGAYLATRHLIERGHRQIAFFGGHAASSSCHQRRAGFQQALAEAGLSLPPGWMIESAPNRLEAAARTDELFADGHRPSAAVCYNDTVALGLMLGLNSRGIRPGGDFAVTGFDDISEASVAVPPLTTLTADPRERGRQAAALLLQRLDEPDAPPRRTVAPVQLRIRESSAARPN